MQPLDKAYDPKKYESDIYRRWEDSGAFKPESARDPKAEPFTIIMPPPNANGQLHSGHGMYVVEDLMIRYQRMRGRRALWLPGTDHAGIETQFVFERDVLAKDGQTRFDLGREQFYEDALAFTLKNQPTILGQFRSLGFSADWSRLKFTLDDDILAVVYDTFKRLHDDGLIYRGNRIVNWCPRCRSSFADIEVKHLERDDELYELDYGVISIATTRPETIFADAAVAVHPEDGRYRNLVGAVATIPLVNRPIPVIADTHVDPSFGTGALKITPAHDKNDYEIGLRHSLPEIQVVDLDGRLVNVPEEFAGLTVDEGRKAAVRALVASGKLSKVTPLPHSVGVHDRCGTVIEPLITEQWYMRVSELNKRVIDAIESGEIVLIPHRFKKIALDWLRQEHDWNIGRQNWFGIRIPVYYKESNDPDKDPYLVTDREEEARAYYGEGNYRAETDTFDTWFSSGQWPYATMMTTGDYSPATYPTQAMMTARDILTKWVTKMIMFSLYRTGQIPFSTVYLWGMVNDEHGKKMSKSKGNVINPLAMTEKYGTDALRLALTIGITPGNDGSLSERKIEGYRNFNNKLWNVARFILGQLPDGYTPQTPKFITAADLWIASRLSKATKDVTRAIEEYRFSEGGQTVYSLLWDDFADWYIEASKVEPNHDLLVEGLQTILKLAHPMAPFVTEAIWSHLPWHTEQLIVSPWPTAAHKGLEEGSEREFAAVIDVVTAARSLSAEENLVRPVVLTTSELVAGQAALVARLGRLGGVRKVGEGTGLYLGTAPHEAWIEATPEMIAGRRSRLQKDREAQQRHLKGLESKLANEGYLKNAPEAVVEETKRRREETLMLVSKLDEQLKDLK